MHKKVYQLFTRIIILTAVGLSVTLTSHAQQDSVKDIMGLPGPLEFNKTTFNLAWSAKPTGNYFKQQYLAQGESLERYHKVLVIDILLDTIKPKALAYYKVRSLEQRKKVDAVADYHLIQSPDSSEYIVDFIQSERTPANNYIEWNAYRYKAFKNADGKKGVLLFGISMRAYGNKEEEALISNLRDVREDIIGQLIAYKLPAIKVQ